MVSHYSTDLQQTNKCSNQRRDSKKINITFSACIMFNEEENLLSGWWNTEGKQNSTGRSFNLKAEGGLYCQNRSDNNDCHKKLFCGFGGFSKRFQES